MANSTKNPEFKKDTLLYLASDYHYNTIMNNQFICQNCHQKVKIINTLQRNHCPNCLFSKHLDEIEPGDRSANCLGLMAPIGLTLKKVKPNKYNSTPGELMIIHQCIKCEKVSINRIATDDETDQILNTFNLSKVLPNIQKQQLENLGINLCMDNDLVAIKKQLYGKEIK